MAKWSAVESFEVHNTRREWTDGEGKFYAFVKLMVPWGNRFKLLQDLYTSSLGSGGRTTTTGYAPRAYPGGEATASGSNSSVVSPNMTKIGVTSATIHSWNEAAPPRDIDLQVMDPASFAFVDVQYGRRFNIQETIEFDTEIITQTYRDFLWATKASDDDFQNVHELEVPMATLYTAILTREFIGLASVSLGGALIPDFRGLADCVGFTNPSAYTSIQLGKTFKEGTLLMIEPDVRPSTDMQNFDATNSNNFSLQGYTATVKFLYKRGAPTPPQSAIATDINTHNLFWRPRMYQAQGDARGGWDRLLIKEEKKNKSQYKPYEPFKHHSAISGNGWLAGGLLPIPVS